jgi:DNA-binding response OmpR family regulator
MVSTAELLDLSVLIVDPDRQTREALCIYFRIHGYAASTAGNAAEAEAAMAAQSFDLIIAEYCLPDENGVSVLRSYGERQEGAIRILTTAYSCNACRIRGDLTGIDDVVRKPFTGDELLNRIEHHTFGRIARIAEPVMPLHP